MTDLTEPIIRGRSARTQGRGKAAPVEPWLYWARCAGVRDFTEWPKASRLIICGACTVAEPCHEWQAHQRCEKGHKRRRDECSGCQDFTTMEGETP